MTVKKRLDNRDRLVQNVDTTPKLGAGQPKTNNKEEEKVPIENPTILLKNNNTVSFANPD
jgi:hypothetical protein